MTTSLCGTRPLCSEMESFSSTTLGKTDKKLFFSPLAIMVISAYQPLWCWSTCQQRYGHHSIVDISRFPAHLHLFRLCFEIVHNFPNWLVTSSRILPAVKGFPSKVNSSNNGESYHKSQQMVVVSPPHFGCCRFGFRQLNYMLILGLGLAFPAKPTTLKLSFTYILL